MRALAAFAVLFVLYQTPQGVNDALLPDRRIWLALTLAFFPVASLVARALGGTGIRDYGLTPPAMPKLPLGIVLGLAASAGSAWLGHALGFYRIDSIAPVEEVIIPAVLLAVGSALASLAEDILTRGFLWKFTALRHLPTPQFAAISAAVFLANHIYVLKRGPALWAFIFALGFGLAWALHRTGSLWMTFGAHWGWNLAYHWTSLTLTTTDLAPSSSSTWVSALTATALTLALMTLTRSKRQTGES